LKNIKFHENRPVRADIFHAEGRTDMTKLTVLFFWQFCERA